MLSLKKIISAFSSLCLGILIIFLVLNRTEVSGEQVLNKLQHLNLFFVALVIVTTFIHLWVSAYKWRIITQKLSKNNQKSQDFYLGGMSGVYFKNCAFEGFPCAIVISFFNVINFEVGL